MIYHFQALVFGEQSKDAEWGFLPSMRVTLLLKQSWLQLDLRDSPGPRYSISNEHLIFCSGVLLMESCLCSSDLGLADKPDFGLWTLDWILTALLHPTYWKWKLPSQALFLRDFGLHFFPCLLLAVQPWVNSFPHLATMGERVWDLKMDRFGTAHSGKKQKPDRILPNPPLPIFCRLYTFILIRATWTLFHHNL